MLKTVKEILNADISDIRKLNNKELKEVTRILSAAGNKRIKRLEKMDAGNNSPAYKSAKTAGAKFTAKGKNRAQMMKEYSRAKKFIKAKTSTVSGWKKVKLKLDTTLEKATNAGISPNDFWNAFNKFSESDKIAAGGSDRLLQLFSAECSQTGNADEAFNNIAERLTGIYEEQEETDDFFEDIFGDDFE